jgi:Alpha amylase, C-terminal all-beta domain
MAAFQYVPDERFYQEILDSDSELYAGSKLGNAGLVSSRAVPKHSRKNSIEITLPPLGIVVFRETLRRASFAQVRQPQTVRPVLIASDPVPNCIRQ